MRTNGLTPLFFKKKLNFYKNEKISAVKNFFDF